MRVKRRDKWKEKLTRMEVVGTMRKQNSVGIVKMREKGKEMKNKDKEGECRLNGKRDR